MSAEQFCLRSIRVSKCGDGYLGYSDADTTSRKAIDPCGVEDALSDLGFDISNEYELYPGSYSHYYLQNDELLPDEEHEWVSVELQFARKVSKSLDKNTVALQDVLSQQIGVSTSRRE